MNEIQKGVTLALFPLFLTAPFAEAGINRWTPVGPYGGTITAVSADPRTPGVIYAGATGVFKSSNGGRSWTLVNQGLPPLETIRALAVSPADPAIVYAAFESQLVGEVLFKTTDGGETWSVVNPDSPLTVDLLALHPEDASVVWASGYRIGKDGGVYKSTDGGVSWTLSRRGAHALVVDPGDPSTVYAVVGQGVARTTDGGKTWSRSKRGLPPLERASLAVVPGSPGTLVLAGWVGESRPTFRSTDRGTTWVASGPGGFPVTAGPDGRLYTSTARSSDGGLTWEPIDLPDGELHVLTADPNSPGTVYAGFETLGLFKTTDGAESWQDADEGITARKVLQLAAQPTDPTTLYALTYQGLLLFKKQGEGRWINLGNNLTGGPDFVSLYSLVADASGVYVVVEFDDKFRLLKSTDGGVTWEVLDYGPVHVLTLDPRAPGTIYAAGPESLCGVSKSTDGGKTWRCLRQDTTAQVVLDPSRPQTLYALTHTWDIFRSLDGGKTWRRLRNCGLPKEHLGKLFVDPARPDNLYVTTEFRTFKSTDGGRNWKPAGPGMENIASLWFDPRNPSILYTIFADGVYRSTDAGRHWKLLAPGLSRNAIGSSGLLLFDPRDPDTLYLGGATVFQITLPRNR